MEDFNELKAKYAELERKYHDQLLLNAVLNAKGEEIAKRELTKKPRGKQVKPPTLKTGASSTRKEELVTTVLKTALLEADGTPSAYLLSKDQRVSPELFDRDIPSADSQTPNSMEGTLALKPSSGKGTLILPKNTCFPEELRPNTVLKSQDSDLAIVRKDSDYKSTPWEQLKQEALQ